MKRIEMVDRIIDWLYKLSTLLLIAKEFSLV